MTCEICKYWNPTPAVGGGQCQRYAPRPSNSKLDRTYWPRTDADASCGEYVGRNA